MREIHTQFTTSERACGHHLHPMRKVTLMCDILRTDVLMRDLENCFFMKDRICISEGNGCCVI